MDSRLLGLLGRRDRRGGALVMALLSVSLVVVFGASFLQLSSVAARRQGAALDTKQAFYLADAGLAEAYRGLCIGKTGAVGTEAAPAAYGSGLFWVEASDAGDGRVRLDSTGMVGTSRVVLSLVAEPGDTTSFAQAVFTAEDLSLAPGTQIDSYDSRDGAYADQRGKDASLEGVVKVGSNGDIAISGTAAEPTLIRGDVSPGPAKTLSTTDDVYLSGDTSPAPAARVLPPVDVPAISKLAGVAHSGALPLVVPPGEHGVDFLSVGRDAEVVLQGPSTIVVGSLTLAGGSQLSIDTTTGTVSLFVEDALDVERGSVVVNTTKVPGSFVLQYAGDTAATLLAAGALEAVVYAPLAQVLVGGGAEVFGSLVARELTFSGPASLHFDRALLAEASETSVPQLMTWRILDLGQTGGGSMDPFGYLGVDPASCAKPADAHEDQMLALTYVDLGGSPQTYSGMESAFDWTQVREVQTIARDGVDVTEDVQTAGAAGAEPRPLTPAEQATVDFIKADPPPSANELRNRLLAEHPVSKEVLVEAIMSGVMNSPQLYDVFMDNTPLDDAIVTLILDGTAPLNPVDKSEVLAAQ